MELEIWAFIGKADVTLDRYDEIAAEIESIAEALILIILAPLSSVFNSTLIPIRRGPKDDSMLWYSL